MASELQRQREAALIRRREYFLNNSSERKNEIYFSANSIKPRPFTPTVHNLNEPRARETHLGSLKHHSMNEHINLDSFQDRDTICSSSPQRHSSGFDNKDGSLKVSRVDGPSKNEISEYPVISNSTNFSKGRVLHKQATTGTLCTALSNLTDEEDSELVVARSQYHVVANYKDHNIIDDQQESNKDYIRSWSEKNDWGDTAQVKDFLLKPVPKLAGVVQCCVRRSRKHSKLFPEYRVYLEEGNRFLMSSKKRKKNTSNYLISTKRNDHNKGSDNIIGKLRSNFLGTEYQIFDDGKNPKSFDPFFDENNEDIARNELGVILYGNNLTNTRGPRRMNVCINKVGDKDETTRIWQPCRLDDESMLNSFKQNSESALRHLLYLESRQPKWDEDMCAFVLNFKKRVTLASVKNFQLVDKSDDTDKVILQFGRKGNDEFIMDVRWPMSLFQAFAISLSACDSKIACD
jgi:tubby-related protein 1